MVGMRNVKMVITYDGTDYCGWQIQPNGLAIQEVLAGAFEQVTGERVVPVGSGRTDSGVHAMAQVANAHIRSRLSAATLLRALNAQLPETIVIREVVDAPLEFDAARDATGKLYRYTFHDGPTPEVFRRRYCWNVHHRLDVEAMRIASQPFLGTRCFAAMETEYPNRASSIRTVRRCDPRREGDFVLLDVEADGFLYNMVRTIAGTLYEVGRGRWPVESTESILKSRDRRQAGPTAPAQGLCLVRVDYNQPVVDRRAFADRGQAEAPS